MALVKTWAEPYKIKMVEPVFMTTKAKEKKQLKQQDIIRFYSNRQMFTLIF